MGLPSTRTVSRALARKMRERAAATLVADGHSAHTTARVLHMDRKTVGRIAKKHGVKLRSWQSPKHHLYDVVLARVRAGETRYTVARELGVPPRTVYRWCTYASLTLPTYRQHTAPTVRKVVAMIDAGATVQAAADAHNVPWATARYWSRRAKERAA